MRDFCLYVCSVHRKRQQQSARNQIPAGVLVRDILFTLFI